MHIYIDNGANPMPELQLPVDFWPELSKTNPFLTEEGSQSIPLTFPSSSHNLKLIGFDYRQNQRLRPRQKIPAIFVDGAVWIKGTLYIEKANEETGIECTFYLSEGELYERIKNLKLTELDWPEWEGTGSSMTDKVRFWMSFFSDLLNTDRIDPRFSIVTVETSELMLFDNKDEQDYYLALNELKLQNNGQVTFWAWDEQSYYMEHGEDAPLITAPVGFGVTPFLRLSFVLRHIMQYLGYTLEENPFDNYSSYQKTLLGNNVADAIVDGTIHCSQLLPDISLEEFINAVRNKFGLEFIVKGTTVKIEFGQVIFQAEPDNDLSHYIRNTSTIEIQEKSAIEIEYQTLTEIPERVRTHRGEATISTRSPETAGRDRVIAVYNLNKTLKHNVPPEYEAISLDIKDKTPVYWTVKTARFVEEAEGATYFLTLNIGDVNYLNTSLRIGNDTQEQDNNTLSLIFLLEEEGLSSQINKEGDIAYKWKRGYLGWEDEAFTLLANEYGEGKVSAKNNMYEVFYKSKDEFYKKANQLIIYEANMDIHIIQRLSILPKIINGQKVMIERIDYVMGRPELCQITARTLHQYED